MRRNPLPQSKLPVPPAQNNHYLTRPPRRPSPPIQADQLCRRRQKNEPEEKPPPRDGVSSMFVTAEGVGVAWPVVDRGSSQFKFVLLVVRIVRVTYSVEHVH